MNRIKQILLIICLLVQPVQVYAEITLAIIAPKAGEHVKSGTELFNGAKLAIEEINNNGGLNGEKVDVLTIDDRCDDRLAVSTAEMLGLLTSKKIGLVIGPYCSNRFNEVADIYEKAQIFQIVPTTVEYNSGSIEKKGRILLLGTQSQMSGDFFKFYNNNFAGIKVGFVYDDNNEDGYSEVAKTLFEEFRRYGKSDLLKFYTINSNSNTKDIIKNIKKDKIGVVFVLADRDDTYNFIENIKDKNENTIIFSTKKMLPEKSLSRLGKDANGIYLLSMPGLKDSLMFTEELVNLRLKGIEPEGLEAYSYVAVKLWGDLVHKVGSFSYKQLSNAANSTELKEKWGEFLMHSGSIKSSKYTIEQFINGEFKQVY